MEQAHRHHEAAAAAEVGGLAVASAGYRLEPVQTTFPLNRPAPFRFTVHGRAGPEREFDEHGGVQMHLIVVRRDLTGYIHLHPRPAPDGTWATELLLPDAGVYRAYADFERGGRQTVLGVDLFVAGAFAPHELPPPVTDADDNGYHVELEGRVHAGAHGKLGYRLSREGSPLSLEPYLGAAVTSSRCARATSRTCTRILSPSNRAGWSSAWHSQRPVPTASSSSSSTRGACGRSRTRSSWTVREP